MLWLTMKAEEDLEEATFRAIPQDSRGTADLNSLVMETGRTAFRGTGTAAVSGSKPSGEKLSGDQDFSGQSQ